MTLPLDPPERAVRDHFRWHGPWPYAACYRCGKSHARCRDKVAYVTREDVDQVVREINEREDYADPAMRYPCPWGDHWHVTHAKKPRDLRRARRAGQRWRLAQLQADAPC